MSKVRIICLCAAWCHMCRALEPDFHALAEQHPEADWLWIDVEDEAALVGDLEIETFPTLLIGTDERATYFGPAPANDARFRGFVEQALQGRMDSGAAGVDVDAAELYARLQTQAARS